MHEDLAAARQQHQLPERAPARTPTMGPLSVQALEAGVASVLLEGSRIGRRDLHPPSPRARSGERRRSFGQARPLPLRAARMRAPARPTPMHTHAHARAARATRMRSPAARACMRTR